MVPLGAGRTLIVRPATPADAAARAGPLPRPPGDDRYLRFFSAGPSLERFVEGWVRNEERGGHGPVAVLHEAVGAERPVADPGDIPPPTGTASSA